MSKSPIPRPTSALRASARRDRAFKVFAKAGNSFGGNFIAINAVVTFLAVCPLPASATEPPVFEDSAAKGSLMSAAYPAIPKDYRGHWADRLENCYATADRGQQVTISDTAIGSETVLQVDGYSDHRAIIVVLTSEDGAHSTAFLDIALDGRYISIRSQDMHDPDILLRCPPAATPGIAR
jgi:hypothetical protein